MTVERLKVAVIVGSTRVGRVAPAVAAWFAGEARRHADVAVDLVDLADLRLPAAIGGEPGADSASLAARLEEADAYVVVTPEYNHSFPGVLKDAIDHHYTQWQAKPVGFVSYGGLAGGLRAVEQLRQVFAELHAVTVRDTVSFHGVWDHFGGDGTPVDVAAANAAAGRMLDQLVWWGRALRSARSVTPYAA
jgi:NAD(P)H-dependent FMN reductase